MPPNDGIKKRQLTKNWRTYCRSNQARVARETNGDRVLEPWFGVIADWIQGRPSTRSMKRTVVWSFWKR